MPILNAITALFLLPGTLVLKAVGITIEEDGGILRSLVNMLFWGVVAVFIVIIIVFGDGA
mgnify:CR=1 FL=1